ncbi:uncharacterized protein [Littorina saxatilis]|uniref:uncharacterized protein n=1 Tax=Littorina saxatilis TaxID=31220 RepID=UPI0038B50139
MRMTPPVAPVLTVNRIMAGLGCLMTLLLLILQVDSSAIHKGKREVPGSGCSKLEFWSEGLKKCFPCHLCGPEGSDPKAIQAIRTECKNKNPEPITHHGGEVAWCDDPDWPLPECPPLPEQVSLSNISTKCRENHRKYAPGCKCTIGCGDKKSLALHCTQDLTWSGATENEIEACQAFSISTLQRPTTEDPGPKTNNNKVKEGGNLMVVLSSAIAFTIVATIVVVIVVACVCMRRQRGRVITSNQSSPSSSENSSEIGADSPLISKTSGASVESPVSQSIPGGRKEKEAYTGASDRQEEVEEGASAQPSAVTSHQVVREVPFPAPGDNSKEENALQTRQAEPKPVLCMGLSKKHQEAEVHIQGVLHNSEEQTGNDQRNALKEFLNSLNELEQFTKMFDQKYSLDRISWHDVAQRLVNWNTDDVKSLEYILLPNSSSSPGDGPTYKVLKEALHEGKGLSDLLHCLQSFHFPLRNFTAEKQLEDFAMKWKAEHARQ